MNSVVFVNIVRFILVVLIQSLIFRRITFDWNNFGYVHILIYPVFVLSMPLKTPRTLQILLAFLMGILIDIFYNSPGIHASALVFTAYIRAIVLKTLEPYGGYNVDDSPTLATMGISWYMPYLAILLLIHIFFYFSVEAFSFVYIYEIIMNTIFSYIISILIILTADFIFRFKI